MFVFDPARIVPVSSGRAVPVTPPPCPVEGTDTLTAASFALKALKNGSFRFGGSGFAFASAFGGGAKRFSHHGFWFSEVGCIVGLFSNVFITISQLHLMHIPYQK